jgi:hypothetical protein
MIEDRDRDRDSDGYAIPSDPLERYLPLYIERTLTMIEIPTVSNDMYAMLMHPYRAGGGTPIGLEGQIQTNQYSECGNNA